MATFGANDFFFTMSGDFLIDQNGDIRDVKNAPITDISLQARQVITHRIIAEKNGWRSYPTLCGSLEQFLGKAITPELLRAIERQVNFVLTVDGLFDQKDLTIKAIDIGAGTEAIVLTIYVKGVSTRPVFVSSFDMQTGQISQVL